MAAGMWYWTSSTRELSGGGAKRARVWWAIGMRFGTLLGGRYTLGVGGRVGCFGEGVSLNTSRVGVACRNWFMRRAGAGVHGTDAGKGEVTTGGTRYLVFTVVVFKCMERIVGTIHCCCW